MEVNVHKLPQVAFLFWFLFRVTHVIMNNATRFTDASMASEEKLRQKLRSNETAFVRQTFRCFKSSFTGAVAA